MTTPSPLRRAAPAALLLLALAAPLLPQAQAAAPTDFPTLFARPAPTYSIVQDPWAGGVWAGTAMGLLFRDSSTGALTQYSTRDGLPSTTVHQVAATATDVWIVTAFGPAVL